MKKILLIVAVLTVVVSNSNAQVNLGIHASGIMASGKQTEKDEDASLTIKHKSRASWKVGVSAAFPVSEHFSIMPQLNLLSKGGKPSHSYSFTELGLDYSFKLDGEMKLTYLELPVNFVYQSKGFMIGAGPSISMGLDGKGRITYTEIFDGDKEVTEINGKVKFDGKADADDENLHMERFELGANFIAGYTFKNNLSVFANFNLGLSDVSPAKESEYKNRYFGIGIGYWFGRKR